MDDKKKGLVVGAVVVVLVLVGLPYLRWFQFELDARSALTKEIGRHPTPEKIVAFPARLAEVAKGRGFTTTSVKLTVVGKAAGPAILWSLVVHAESGSHVFSTAHPIWSGGGIEQDGIDVLEEGGIAVQLP